MSVYLRVTNETPFQVIDRFDHMVYDFLEPCEINVKLSFCLIKHHTMKPYGGEEI
jgi:hypothetical protein